MNYNDLNYSSLEQKIGYHLNDPTLLRRALTHKSFSHEYHIQQVDHYERLEYLGDAILEYIASEELYNRYPELQEGELTKKRASLVCEYTLSRIALELGYGEAVFLSNGELQTGGRERPSILCDLFESVLGAIYLDGGLESAKQYVATHLMTDLEHRTIFTDAKTILQEYSQKQGHMPEYPLISTKGPDHAKKYTVAVKIGGKTYATATAGSIKGAQMEAAHETLRMLGIS